MKERIMKLSDFENMIEWEDFTIYGTYTGSKPANWEVNGHINYHHNLIVATLKLHVFGNTFKTRKLTFDYWGSIMEPQVRHKSLIYAFKQYLEDGWNAENAPFENWCRELGYDEDSRKAYSIYLQCEKAYAKALKFLGSYDNIEKVLNELSEWEDNQ